MGFPSSPTTTTLFFVSIFLVLCVGKELSDQYSKIKDITHVLKPGEVKSIHKGHEFQMYCRVGEKKYMIYYFRTATLRITSTAEDIKLIKGHGPVDVYLQHTTSTKWLLWIANVLPWRAKDTNFPTFNNSCVGIQTSQPYTAMMIIKPIDLWKVVTLAAGLTMFFMAPNLSQSTMFFYSSGTLLGGLAAALIFLFVVTRFLPKGKSGILMTGLMWTMSFYFAGEIWKRIEEFMHERLPYLVAYLFVGAVVSFLACYRFGPPSNPRTLDIIRWALQIGGLVLIHFSSDLVEMSTAIILILILYHNANLSVKYYFMRYFRRWFPPPQRLLTEEEYITQGAIETQKGLKELKSFCSTPESKPWMLVAKLKNPRRFSNFMEGGSHLNDDEVLAYDLDDGSAHRPKAISPASGSSSASTRRSLPAAIATNNSNYNNFSGLPITDDEESSEGTLDDSIETDDDQ